MKRKIYNGFMFFNEFDMLDIRLNELWDTVDKFILVESPQTHRGGNKELFFDKFKSNYKKYESKLIHVIKELPNASNPWVNENEHRRGIMDGLEGIKNQDYLIINDADEIPRASSIASYTGDLAILSMYFHYYKFNLRNKYNWPLAKMVRYGTMDKDINEYRKELLDCDTLINAGWHFSKVYGLDQMKYMFKECLADDLFHDVIIDNLEQWSNEGITDWCGYYNKFSKVEIDNTFPEYFRNNIDKFKNFIA